MRASQSKFVCFRVEGLPDLALRGGVEGSRVQRLGFRVWCLGSRVEGLPNLALTVGVWGSPGLSFRVDGLGCRICGLGYRV